MEDFVIKQGRFEGPYVKLLEMIEDRKMSISEISLSKIADEYIAYVKDLPQINNLDLSQFIVIAATLMLMKAKSLLPSIEYTKEEKEQVGDLENKLEIYRIIKEGEKNIKSKWQKTTLYNRQRTTLKEKVFSPDKSFTKENLFSVVELTLAKMPNFAKIREVAVRQVIKLEEVLEKMLSRIQDNFSSLKTFAGTLSNDQKEVKKMIIVSFLALLELLKSGNFEAESSHDGTDLKIIKKV